MRYYQERDNVKTEKRVKLQEVTRKQASRGKSKKSTSWSPSRSPPTKSRKSRSPPSRKGKGRSKSASNRNGNKAFPQQNYGDDPVNLNINRGAFIKYTDGFGQTQRQPAINELYPAYGNKQTPQRKMRDFDNMGAQTTKMHAGWGINTLKTTKQSSKRTT